MLKKLLKQVVYYLWVLYGYVGWKLRSQRTEAITVLITYYNPVRLRHVNHQIRNVLKCEFVKQVVVSSHNPEVKINDHVTVQDQRIVLLNQGVARPCGYRWKVARQLSFDYLVVVDDDIVLFPWQLKVLFESLVREPGMPHGLSGMLSRQNGTLQFRQRENTEVHYLTEMYAVSRKHVEQYFELYKALTEQDESISNEIESIADFVVISQTGVRQPRIHRAGRIYRDETYNADGVAVHRNERFSIAVKKVSQAVAGLRPLFFGQ